jgi:hypothetical protein
MTSIAGVNPTRRVCDASIDEDRRLYPTARWCFVLALIGFGLSALFGLMHRYFSTDSMACLLKRYRLEAEVAPDDARIRKEKARLGRAFDLSAWSIGASGIFLGLGAAVLAVGFVLAISQA